MFDKRLPIVEYQNNIGASETGSNGISSKICDNLSRNRNRLKTQILKEKEYDY